MKLLLRTKLVISFVTVIAISGFVATAVGVRMIGSGIVREAQNKVTLDLNSAQQIYQQRLHNIETLLMITAMRMCVLIAPLQEGQTERLLENLQEVMRKTDLDFLALTDPEGLVVVRAQNPGVFGDSQAGDAIIGKVLQFREPVSHSQIMTRDSLARESEALVNQARITLLATPRARPRAEETSTAGMVVKAAVPVHDEAGTFLGVLYGGKLLNRNYAMVDKIKDVVYQGVK